MRKKPALLLRVSLIIVLMVMFSATAKWVIFNTLLVPDGSGRQPVETHDSNFD
ncbi:hypothetical protein [Allohahella marinimesophila]|uniref:Uncharacterized protein n=1 Tax=Allohahella marinimesophila TaxID=1054972 RepID=A0ABP7PBK1_9GAMM